MRTNIVSILRDKAGGVVTAFRKKSDPMWLF